MFLRLVLILICVLTLSSPFLFSEPATSPSPALEEAVLPESVPSPAPAPSVAPLVLLEAKKGVLNTYQVVLQDEKLRIDLGFHTYIDLSESNKKLFKAGDILSMRGGKITNQGEIDDRYTYSAKVTDILDGDTFHALVNLGFGITREEKLQLRTLDAPSVSTEEGKKAKTILEQVLLRDKGWITIKTSKGGRFGRYLSEIWVKDQNVNQELAASSLYTLRSSGE